MFLTSEPEEDERPSPPDAAPVGVRFDRYVYQEATDDDQSEDEVPAPTVPALEAAPVTDPPEPSEDPWKDGTQTALDFTEDPWTAESPGPAWVEAEPLTVEDSQPAPPTRLAWRYGTILDTVPDLPDPNAVGAWIPGLDRWVSWVRPEHLGLTGLGEAPEPERDGARMYGVRTGARLVVAVTDTAGTPLAVLAARPQRDACAWLPERALRTASAHWDTDFATPDLSDIVWARGWCKNLEPAATDA